jgi:hypothetical protein
MTKSTQLCGGEKVLNVSKIAAVSMLVSLILVAGFLTVPALSMKTPSLFRTSVVVTKEKLHLAEVTLVFLYIENNAPFGVYGFRGVREGLGNALILESIEYRLMIRGAAVISRTDSVRRDITFEPPTVTRTITDTFGAWVGRLSPIVLPGEKVAVYYGSNIVGCEEEAGVYEWIFTVHAKFQDSPVVLTDSGKFKVEASYPPCVMSGVLASVTGVPVVGATITLTDLETNDVVATTSTNSFGVFFFDASTVHLVIDRYYRLDITKLPSPFTTVSPSSCTFRWTGSTATTFEQLPWPFWAS